MRALLMWVSVAIVAAIAIFNPRYFDLNAREVTTPWLHHSHAKLDDPVELPYNEDMSTAFNGTYAFTVTDNAVTIYDYASGTMAYAGNDLTNALFCSQTLLPTPEPCGAIENDARVKYDWAHGRWIVTAISYDAWPSLWFAVSSSSDPFSSYYVYRIPTCGWDQPALGLTRNYATIVEDVCNSLSGVSNTFRVNLYDAEHGKLNWWYTVSGASGMSVFRHPVSEQGPTLPNDDIQYTVQAETKTVNGVTYPGLQIGEYNDSANTYSADWRDYYTSVAGSPMPHTFDAPGSYQGISTQPIEAIESGVMAAWNGQSLIFAGYPTKSGSKYTLSLFAVPAQTSGGSVRTLTFTPAGEVMAVTMHPCASTGKVAIGAIETSPTIYPRLVEYSWNLATNTVSGPLVVVAGNVTPVGYDAGRWEEFVDGSDCVNGVADIEGQVADGYYQDKINTYSNPYAQGLGFVRP